MEEKLSDSLAILDRLTEKRVGKNILSETPEVSVIIPAYNIATTVFETLDSVLSQTFKSFEIVLVNDGSKDTAELEDALKPYFDNIVYGKQENLGASAARNLAISMSRGGLLAFLDGDDIWFPKFLESQVKALEEKDLEMIYCDAKFFGENFTKGECYSDKSPSVGEVNPISLIVATVNVITSGTILKRNVLERFGMFDPESVRAQDFDLWFRLAKNGVKIGYQKKVLLKYRVSSESLSGNNVERAERNVTILELLRDKYEFTSEESQAIENQLTVSRAELELETGKAHLMKGEYEEAKEYFKKANKFYQKPKLSIVNLLMNVSPKLVVYLFKNIRPMESSFIETSEKTD